jgi:hypothetical protein
MEETKMAFKCKGTWFSWINPGTTDPPPPPNDGQIIIDAEDEAGDFGGTHGNSGKPIKGKCKEQGNDHHVDFEVEIDDCTHRYWGQITKKFVSPNFIDVVRNGKHTKTCRNDQRQGNPLTTPDEWIAEKQT